MSNSRKTPVLPKFIPRKYHHEIKCLLEQFQRDILCDILKNAELDDNAFVEVSTFSHFADCPTSVLRKTKDIRGNDVSKRLFEIRTGKGD